MVEVGRTIQLHYKKMDGYPRSYIWNRNNSLLILNIYYFQLLTPYCEEQETPDPIEHHKHHICFENKREK